MEPTTQPSLERNQHDLMLAKLYHGRMVYKQLAAISYPLNLQ